MSSSWRIPGTSPLRAATTLDPSPICTTIASWPFTKRRHRSRLAQTTCHECSRRSWTHLYTPWRRFLSLAFYRLYDLPALLHRDRHKRRMFGGMTFKHAAGSHVGSAGLFVSTLTLIARYPSDRTGLVGQFDLLGFAFPSAPFLVIVFARLESGQHGLGGPKRRVAG